MDVVEDPGPVGRHVGVRPPCGAGWLSWKRTEVGGRTAVYGEAGEGLPSCSSRMGPGPQGVQAGAVPSGLRRVRVVAPALPGFGGTAALPGRGFDLRAFVRWLEAFLDVIGVTEPALVMGHSLGGGVAVQFAYHHPERTRALVLVNSIGGSAWTHRGSTLRSMAERPLWDWGIHLPADIFPMRQARRVLPVIVAEALPNLIREPGPSGVPPAWPAVPT